MGIDTSDSLVSHLKRINLIAGKGGVGRTTLAATLARASAAQGKRTLLAEIEDESGWDSPLARSFGFNHFKNEPEQVEKNLFGVCLSAPKGQGEFLHSFLKLQSITNMILSNQGVKWFLDGAPAFKEMGYFYHLLLLMKRDYDVIILDLPATGHLIGLARLPHLLLKMMPFGPIAEKVKEGQRYLYDEHQTATWIVTLPQTLPVSEAVELRSALQSESLPVGGYILNRAPFNPFSIEEEKMLEALSEKSKTKKLMVELERIRRYREAQAKLAEDLSQNSGSLWSAPEYFNPISDPGYGTRVRPIQL